jgi:FtsH-binding integral membrane protein
MLPPKYAKLAGLGAFGACAGMVALFALMVWFTRHTSTGGMTTGLWAVEVISMVIVFLCLIAAHVAIGKQLMHIGNDGGPTRV